MLTEMWSLRGRYKILHLTWFAFFLTFVCWFNFVPFQTTWEQQFQLNPGQIKTLGICNLALTIPARIIIGMVLDKFGPRVTFSGLLMFALIPCLETAFAQDFNQLVLARLVMGIVGAGFVVGIRMVSEWFPPKEIGIAEGIYGGWGNFGAFGAKSLMPIIATATSFLAAGALNWRFAIALSGFVTALYGWIYYNSVQDTPDGEVYRKPKKSGGMQVTSVPSFWAYILSNFGLIFALGLLAWRLMQVKFLDLKGMYLAWLMLAILFAYQSYQAWQVNKELLQGRKTFAPQERYQFGQVALLEFTYVTNFGTELTAITVLPPLFEKTFGLSPVMASAMAASYSFLNLVSRPSGGLISDKLGSRKWTITLITIGIGFSYLLLQGVNAGWPIPVAIAITMISAYFAQAGCGATYGIVPLIKKEITGQIAGNVGAYGNFGGVVFLTIFSLTDAPTLFKVMGLSALICASLCAFFLKEPKDSFAAHYADGQGTEETSENIAQVVTPPLRMSSPPE
ncbi:MAG: NarK family nitrate/nitrite MFS transporter [Acaryochloridaceae cyanobacterium CSU_3_4]|nr:NarK family nitrate/nitrite MFS transporter [Acaryochloris sp. SU_5_25]NJN37537.1 NarK family nitrate/nitrite MFS transporter [Acaryochloridaceae cyanobacterium CSU_3_4]